MEQVYRAIDLCSKRHQKGKQDRTETNQLILKKKEGERTNKSFPTKGIEACKRFLRSKWSGVLETSIEISSSVIDAI